MSDSWNLVAAGPSRAALRCLSATIGAIGRLLGRRTPWWLVRAHGKILLALQGEIELVEVWDNATKTLTRYDPLTWRVINTSRVPPEHQ